MATKNYPLQFLDCFENFSGTKGRYRFFWNLHTNKNPRLIGIAHENRTKNTITVIKEVLRQVNHIFNQISYFKYKNL